MGIFDTFKNKEKGIEKEAKVSKAEDQKKLPLLGGKKKKEDKNEKKSKRLVGFEYRIIEAPHVTEKGTHVGQENTYVFRVARHASKERIKRAIQNIYSVKVTDVRTMRVQGKKKQRGTIKGSTRLWKKAYVKLDSHDSINLFEESAPADKKP